MYQKTCKMPTNSLNDQQETEKYHTEKKSSKGDTEQPIRDTKIQNNNEMLNYQKTSIWILLLCRRSGPIVS